MISVASSPTYRGRFAPTPSGPLHLGSLVTALAGFLQARLAGGAWLLRIDDLDRPRCPPGMADRILRQLEAHALPWDEAVRYQTAHGDEYAAALERLAGTGALYPCACSRAQLRAGSLPGPDGPVYAGTCRARALASGSLRLRIGPGHPCIADGWQGRQCRDAEREIGDFVVRRADGQVAYQLACVVDERAQRITEVVRGIDLLGSTFQQRCIQEALALPAPAYRHLPVLVDAHGRKLSKQNHAPPVDEGQASGNLLLALALLQQEPPGGLRGAAPHAIVSWAIAHWDPERIPRTAQIAGGIAYNAVQQSPDSSQ